MKVYLDYETRSDIPIEAGIHNYLKHPSAKVVCLCWAVDDGPVKLWLPGHPYPFSHLTGYTVKWYAHNAWFDLRVWNWLCRKLYDWPNNHLENWVDAMALCGRYGLPQALENVGVAINLTMKKNPRGKILIKKVCCPPYDYNETDLQELYYYCADDVRALRNLCQTLPADYLSDEEQRYWELTQRMNHNGLPIDTKAVKQISGLTQAYQIEHAQRLPDITDGVITKPTQTIRIRKWVNNKGFPMPNLQAETVKQWLGTELPDDVKNVLEIRREFGSTSIAKYKKLMLLAYNGRVYDNLRFYGGHTGRWGGMGFQVHNLPRAKVDNPEKAIESFMDLSVLNGEPIQVAKALIRPMIKAVAGTLLVVVDYSSIENVLLAWVAQDYETLNKFRKGFCQYSDMASTLYNIPYNDILEGYKAGDDEMTFMRLIGKIIILGCGYGMGAGKFQATAAGYGVSLLYDESDRAVNTYRTKYEKIKDLWYDGSKAAVAAVNNPKKTFIYKNIKFSVVKDKVGTSWLGITIPSGRTLYYNNPELKGDTYGPLVSHQGINPYSKKWSRLKLIPGRITENIIQALARDILANGKYKLYKKGYKLLASVHDETITEVSESGAHESLINIRQTMCELPEWGQSIPLKATGFVTRRYRKD